jgi:phosphinothricin acetyltransferase
MAVGRDENRSEAGTMGQDAPGFLLVEAEDAHLPGVCSIYNHAVRETFSIWSETETTVELRRQWMRHRRAQGFPVLAAVDAADRSEVLGYAAYGVFRDFPGYARTVEHSVYVAPHVQRRGVGRALLAELIARACAAQLLTMIGGIDSENTASLALHESLGFERQAYLKGVGLKFGKRLDLVFMVKALATA